MVILTLLLHMSTTAGKLHQSSLTIDISLGNVHMADLTNMSQPVGVTARHKPRWMIQ
jgi:hypothetical protein